MNFFNNNTFFPLNYTIHNLFYQENYKKANGIVTNKAKSSNNQHGNSLATTKPAKGYSLRNKYTGEILKYGETTLGEARYTKEYLNSINAEYVWEAFGTKAEMHLWQHQKIIDYMYVADQRPPLNKSLW